MPLRNVFLKSEFQLRSPYIAEVLSCQVVGLDVRQEMEYFGFGSAADIVR